MVSFIFGPLVQRLEHPAHNRNALGSNPRRSTTCRSDGMVDVADLKSVVSIHVRVRVPSSVPYNIREV